MSLSTSTTNSEPSSPHEDWQQQTRIVATLGPAVSQRSDLQKLLKAGVNAVRLNFSHGEHEQHEQLAAWTREISLELGRDIAIIADLQGPKIRVGEFAEGKIELETGASFILSADWAAKDGNIDGVRTDYEPLAQEVQVGDQLLLNDGLIELQVTKIDGNAVTTEVVVGGELSSRKGLNRRGGGLSADAITDQDKLDMQCVAKLAADYVALSFVKSAADIEYGRSLLQAAGSTAHIIAKIERHEAVHNLEDILAATDAVMVARGDLCVEIGNAALPGVQKRIIRQAREYNRPCITATQMLESMTHSPQPTRAEIMDVANAVLDGTDAVMLSGETAVGEYPAKTVQAMRSICAGAEQELPADGLLRRSSENFGEHFKRVDESIAMAAVYTAHHTGAEAICALTESGNTALWMSRLTNNIPIYALTPHESTRRRIALYRGVQALQFATNNYDPLLSAKPAIEWLQQQGKINAGQRVIMTKGDGSESGGTNTLKLITV